MILFATYEDLIKRKPTTEGILSVEFQGHPGIFLGVDQNGDVYCLIKNDNNIASPGKRLKSISVDYSVNYQANVGERIVAGLFTSIVLPHRNIHLLEVFCTLFEVLISHLPENPSPPEIHAVVDSLVELLSQKTGSIRDRVKGLFGELYLISESQNPKLWVECWHQEANATKDFSFPDAFLEVKTSEGATRKHSFSLAQIGSTADLVPTHMASILIQSDPRGESVFDLLAKIKSKVTDVSLQAKAIRLFFSVIGTDIDEAKDLLFEVLGGAQGVKLYDTATFPRPKVDVGASPDRAISAVAFDLNLEIAEAYGVSPLPSRL